MHWVRLIIFVILPLLLALAAPTLILWAWGNNWPLLPALLAGIMFLAAAIVVHLSGQLSQPDVNEAHEAIWQELHALRRKVDALLAQRRPDAAHEHPAAQHNDGAEREPAAPQEENGKAPGRAAPGTLRDAPAASLARRILTGAEREAPHGTPPEEALAGFQLYMEPVVDITSGQTVLYRAHPALPADGERVYLGRNALLHARTLGRAAALQVRTLDGVLSFARRLQARGATHGIICPLDVAVVAQDEVAERLQLLLDTTAEAARQTCFATPFNDLTASSREARMHLMMLAQAVAGFVIDHESVLAPDTPLPLPLPLPVRHVDVPGRALALAGGLSDMGTLAARYRERGWQIIASDVADAEMARQVAPVAGLARGAHFSPPRRVREEALERQSTGTTENAQAAGRFSGLRVAAAR